MRKFKKLNFIVEHEYQNEELREALKRFKEELKRCEGEVKYSDTEPTIPSDVVQRVFEAMEEAIPDLRQDSWKKKNRAS